MTGKKIGYLILGSLTLVLGALLAVRVLRNILAIGVSSFWGIASSFMVLGLAAYLIWIGARSLRRVGEAVPTAKVRWGRLWLGCAILLSQLKSQLAPYPDLFQPKNNAEAAGMMFAKVLFYIGSAVLIVLAFPRKKQKQPEELHAQSHSADHSEALRD